MVATSEQAEPLSSPACPMSRWVSGAADGDRGSDVTSSARRWDPSSGQSPYAHPEQPMRIHSIAGVGVSLPDELAGQATTPPAATRSQALYAANLREGVEERRACDLWERTGWAVAEWLSER